MKRLFRQPDCARSRYSALVVFALAYLAVLALVVAPDQVVGVLNTSIVRAP